MAKSTKPRKKSSTRISALEQKSINNVKLLLQNTIIGSCQIKENAWFTKRNGRELEKPTQGMTNAFLHLKFKYKFLLGVISRNEKGIPRVTYQIVTLSHQCRLYDNELNDLVFEELKRMFREENQDYVLTTFWIASPNPDIPDVELQTCIYQLLDKYKVFDNMITNYDSNNNIERGRSLHNTTYWYSLLELYELQDENEISN